MNTLSFSTTFYRSVLKIILGYWDAHAQCGISHCICVCWTPWICMSHVDWLVYRVRGSLTTHICLVEFLLVDTCMYDTCSVAGVHVSRKTNIWVGSWREDIQLHGGWTNNYSTTFAQRLYSITRAERYTCWCPVSHHSLLTPRSAINYHRLRHLLLLPGVEWISTW